MRLALKPLNQHSFRVNGSILGAFARHADLFLKLPLTLPYFTVGGSLCPNSALRASAKATANLFLQPRAERSLSSYCPTPALLLNTCLI
nr:MAG TPA: hypothetical protein [Caudoviricetes sp.]